MTKLQQLYDEQAQSPWLDNLTRPHLRTGRLAQLIRTDDVTTVFNERLASPQMADTLSSDLGIGTAVLDTLEGRTSADPHSSYLSIMRANLAAIRKADSCS